MRVHAEGVIVRGTYKDMSLAREWFICFNALRNKKKTGTEREKLYERRRTRRVFR